MMLAIWVCASSLLADLTAVSSVARGEEIVAQWNFSRDDDRNFDGYPDNWTRTIDRDHPHYLKVDIRPHDQAEADRWQKVDATTLESWQWLSRYIPGLPLPPSAADAGVNRYLHTELNSGAIQLTSPPFDVALRFSYRIRAKIKTQGLVHNQASMELLFLDSEGEILKVLPSKLVSGTNDWTEIALGPLTSPPNAVAGRIRLNLQPSGLKDFEGFAGFDDIYVSRMPRIRMECDQPYGLYPAPANPQIRCIVSGLSDSVSMVRFRLLDEQGRVLQSDVGALSPLAVNKTEEETLESGEESAQVNSYVVGSESDGVAEWDLSDLPAGFYRVRSALVSDGTDAFAVEQTFAVLADLPDNPGPFGWSLTSEGRENFPLRVLPGWLEQCRVQWIKYPCWIDASDYQATDDLARFVGRLEDREINIVGVLSQPPESHLSDLNLDGEEPAAIVFRDADIWQPLLEPVMARLSSGVHWWQLGDERDFSFLGRSQLKATIEEIRIKLQGYGQPIKIVLNWPWLDPLPPPESWSWHAVCLSDPISPTDDEIRSYYRVDDPAADADTAGANALASTTSPAEGQRLVAPFRNKEVTSEPLETSKPWLILDPLPRHAYPREQRVRDLVMRMMAVRASDVPAAFVSNPFDHNLAVLRSDGSPDEMLLPWRTTSAIVGQLKPVGSLDLPNESFNVLLANESSATLVVWGEGETTESIYVGDDARQFDAYGRELEIEQIELRGFPQQRIRVTQEPTFVTNIDRTAALWWLNVKLDRERVDSLLGREQVFNVIFKNQSDQVISGFFRVEAPETWNVSSGQRNIVAEPGRERTSPVAVTLRNDATVGTEMLAIDFELDGEKRRRFTVFRALTIGPDDIRIEVTSRLDKDNRLIVRQEIANLSNATRKFDCAVYAPGRLRQRQSVAVPAGATIARDFYWPNGDELLGQTMQLRAAQHDGARTLNFQFVAEK